MKFQEKCNGSNDISSHLKKYEVSSENSEMQDMHYNACEYLKDDKLNDDENFCKYLIKSLNQDPKLQSYFDERKQKFHERSDVVETLFNALNESMNEYIDKDTSIKLEILSENFSKQK